MEKIDMKGIIFRNDWHQLGEKQITDLFNEHFNSVTIQPGENIIKRIKMLEVCTLEILEDRSSSTVYRIRQTDEVFQIFAPYGKLLNYTTEDYYLQEPIADLIKEYAKKDPIFKIEKVSDIRDIVHHLKNPKFRALFIDGTFDKVEWIDQPPEDISQIPKLLRKMGAFYSSYVKK
jgi:hypothetical protein